ncbi:MAG: glycosyltransferase family 2 protein, partial [Salibacteraceae bacterium]
MKISLITSTFNSASTVRDTLESVKTQTYPDVEYIVIDGGSSDDTLKVLADYEDLIDLLVSEPDDGIYDALNKGIKLSTGDVVGFIHSDDLLTSSSVLSDIAHCFENEATDAIYADLDYVDRTNPDKIVRKWRSKPFDRANFHKGWMPAHPTFYLRRKHYMEFGLY